MSGSKYLENGRPRVVVDIDGVIAREGRVPVYGDAAGWNYEACELIPGAVGMLTAFVSRGFHVVLQSSRWTEDYDKTLRWLEKHSIQAGVHYHEICLGKKLRAVLYIDDRAYHFNRTEWTLDAVLQAMHVAQT